VAKKKSKKSGVLTLRIPPEIHDNVALTAAKLGLDVTGLIRLMIRRALPHFQLEARLISIQAEEGMNLLDQWRAAHPNRPIREFWDDYARHQSVRWTTELRDFDARFTMLEAYASTLDPFSTAQKPNRKEQP
jgi:antitoxin component of RelBE/YafQ-DinJ toxin-antitoxin module